MYYKAEVKGFEFSLLYNNVLLAFMKLFVSEVYPSTSHSTSISSMEVDYVLPAFSYTYVVAM